MSDIRVIKRDGSEVMFDKARIISAVTKASNEAAPMYRMNLAQIKDVADIVEKQCKAFSTSVNVEIIQDMVEKSIMEHRGYEVAQLYVRYRYKKTLARHANTTDDKILSLIDLKNEEVKQENSNKNCLLVSTQRDYMAGEVSKDLSERILIPEDIVQAHKDGRIHFHDMDYFSQHSHNCDLINLEDMLQNGTVISGTGIDKPHSFATACNIATQISAQVASCQYGGQTITLSHLAPFVDVSRQKYLKEVAEEFKNAGIPASDEQIKNVAEMRVKEEVKRGVQTIQYQVITLQTTNGQAPFISLFMCLSEVPEGQTRDDLAMIIEEVLKQRIKGVKNSAGVYVTPAFPKLLYCLDETNDHGCKYDYLTALACECTAKRMVPDYISAKKMKELKNGDVYPCMGCVYQWSRVYVKINGEAGYMHMNELWETMENDKGSKLTFNSQGEEIFPASGAYIWDNGLGDFTPLYRVIRRRPEYNVWLQITIESEELHPLGEDGARATGHSADELVHNTRGIEATIDHPFEVEGKGVVLAKDLRIGDKILSGFKRGDSHDPLEIYVVKEIENKTNEWEWAYDVTTESEHFMVNGFYSHNCRSFLTVDRFTDIGTGNISGALNYEEGKHKYYGRFNQGVVTINLPDVALASGGDEEAFWEIFEDRLELCHRALRLRHERLLGTPSDVAPILWQNGAIARLKKGEVIDKLLYGGYSTISLGYAGLYECVLYMTGHSHTDEEGKEFAINVMKTLNDACSKWKAAENIDYSVYGTPLESTTYKFAKCLKEKYGVIEGITDHGYITNSYHVNVREKIDAFTKLKFESEFQALSPGGAISYVEVPNMQDNLEAVRAVVDFIRDNIMYAELNTKSDYCEVCGYDGEIQIVEDKGKLIWECPNCGNTDQTKMSVARRTCGYIGTQFWNQGRTEEIRDRVLHL